MSGSDEPGAAAFVGQAFDDWSTAVTVIMAGLGDRLGLFRALADGPASAEELANRAGVDVRYTREWAAALTAAGYLAHDPATERFSLPHDHRPVLADESHAYFLGGALQYLLGLLGTLDDVTAAFRSGAGVPYAAYGPDVFEGMARMTGTALDNALVERWLPLVPDVETRLRDGCRVADVGCGQGRALLALAAAFPASTFVGYDVHGPQIDAARQGAASSGTPRARVEFAVADASTGLPAAHDVVTAFDVLHDASDPVGMLRGIRAALAPGGTLLLLEPKSAPTIEANAGPVGAALYGTGLLYCVSVSLATGGPGLGACGTPEPVVRSLCADAGFASVDEAPIDNFVNRLWVART